jgi:hypothetical protein
LAVELSTVRFAVLLLARMIEPVPLAMESAADSRFTVVLLDSIVSTIVSSVDSNSVGVVVELLAGVEIVGEGVIVESVGDMVKLEGIAEVVDEESVGDMLKLEGIAVVVDKSADGEVIVSESVGERVADASSTAV